ncbi:MAG: putative arabinose efflux permease, family [Solirubrobacterales bacterium]|nr:putative arabinose efflux permease, family [Solirubrobacterales bacterium]
MTSTTQQLTSPHDQRQPRPRRHQSIGFWVVAVAFLLNMAFSAVPTPLYVLYQQRDGFSNLMVTIVFGVYAVGVIGSLFLGGHLSDWVGRRRVFVPALLANAASAVVFIVDPSLAGLIVARVISGVSVGLTTATATSYLAELHASARPSASQRRAEAVATGSNLGGIGFGPLAAGLLAQFAPAPLVLPYVVFGIALVAAAVAVALSPETVRRPDQPPRYRPQRIAVPVGARPLFYAATLAGLAAFAVFGVFNSLVPSFLAGTLHQSSHAIAGAVPFAAFAGGAAAQMLGAGRPAPVLLRWSIPTVTVGLSLTAAAMWSSSLAMFVVGGVVAGAGAGLVFKGSLAVAASTAPAGSRAEVLAGFFLGAYIGLSVPVVGLGVVTQYVPARDAMLVFAALAAIAIAASVSAVTRRSTPQEGRRRNTPRGASTTAPAA